VDRGAADHVGGLRLALVQRVEVAGARAGVHVTQERLACLAVEAAVGGQVDRGRSGSRRSTSRRSSASSRLHAACRGETPPSARTPGSRSRRAPAPTTACRRPPTPAPPRGARPSPPPRSAFASLIPSRPPIDPPSAPADAPNPPATRTTAEQRRRRQRRTLQVIQRDDALHEHQPRHRPRQLVQRLPRFPTSARPARDTASRTCRDASRCSAAPGINSGRTVSAGSPVRRNASRASPRAA
jgi:hypothetical protein